MADTTQRLAQPAIEYPDRDGRPIGEDTLHFDWIVRIEQWLELLFNKDRTVFVAGDLFWYPVEGEPTIRTAPDAMVAFGRPKGRRGSYKQWEEGNIAPQVVFEVLPTLDRFHETLRKFQFYERYQVEEFYIYKPDTGHLEGWRRVADHLEEVPEMAGFVSPRLGIRFEPGVGPDTLRFIGPDGKRFLTHVEAVESRDAATARADALEKLNEDYTRFNDEFAEFNEECRRTSDSQPLRAAEYSRRRKQLSARLEELGADQD